MTRTVIDLTQSIHPGMQLFPLHSPTQILPWTQRDRFGWTTNALFINEHAGTHLDAPYHFLEDGATVDQLDLSRLTGPALALDLSARWPGGQITADVLLQAAGDSGIQRGDAVLVHTGAGHHLGQEAYLTSYPGLTGDAAQLLVDRGVRLVGTDAPSIDHCQSTEFPAHNTLLPGDVLVVENLAQLPKLIRRAAGRRFTLHTFPLKVEGGTGSPIRAVAVLDSD
jgi:kynurenine formamidase